MKWLSSALLSLFVIVSSLLGQQASSANPSTYTAVAVQYRAGIDTPISVAPHDPLVVEVWVSDTVGASFVVPFQPGMTRRQIANQLADQIRSYFEEGIEVEVHGATVVVKGTSPKTPGTPDKPKESSTNHNRPWLSSSTKTV